MSSFERELLSQLEQLKSSAFDDPSSFSYLNMPWLCRATQLVLSIHSSAEDFLPDLCRVLSLGDAVGFHRYLDDSVKVLDACNALRDAINQIRSYQTNVQSALRVFKSDVVFGAQVVRGKIALRRCSQTLRMKMGETQPSGLRRCKLDRWNSFLRRTGEKLHREDESKGDFFMFSYAAQCVTIFICRVLASALSLDSRHSFSTISVEGPFAWASSFTSLQQRLKEQIERKKAGGASVILEELCMTDNMVRDLLGAMEKLVIAEAFPLTPQNDSSFRELLAGLENSCALLNTALDSLETNVAAMMKVLLASRMVLLDLPTCQTKPIWSYLEGPLPHKQNGASACA